MDKACSIEGCKRKYRAKGYCAMHYRKWRHGEFGNTRFTICSGEDCKGKAVQAGMCEKHFEEWRKTTKGYKWKAKQAPAVEATPATT